MTIEDFKPTIYIGPSMNPTLRATDLLEITPYSNFKQIKVGDVIVFDSPNEKKSITHRVIQITPSGKIITRGDNNSNTDPWELDFSNVTGRVDWAKRGKQHRRIWGGLQGVTYVSFIRIRRFILRTFVWILRPFYHGLEKSKITTLLWPKFFLPKRILFTRHGFRERQLLLGPFVIGRKIPGRKWKIRPPFRLFFDISKY